MALGPWAVTGPWVPSQLGRRRLRRRYVRPSLLVLAAFLVPLLALTILVGEPDKYFHSAHDFLTKFVASKGGPAWIGQAVLIAVPCMVVLTLIQVLPIFWCGGK
jgi:hypothetical protein